MMRQFTLLFGLLIALSAADVARAAQITKIKGTSVLVNLAGDSLRAGDNVYAVNAAGKKKAIIRITKLKGNKALGTLVKGKAAPGMNLIPRAGGSVARNKSRPTHDPAEDESNLRRAYYGVLLGYGMDTMSVAVNRSTDNKALGTVAMSGSGFSGKGLVDYELFHQVWFRGTAGVEQFNVSGAAICGTGNRTACDAKLMYGTMDFVLRYLFTTGNYRPWLGLGLGLLFPINKPSTALSESSVGTTNVIQALGGMDIAVGEAMYIPVSVEYGLLPKSDQVEAHWITVRAGLAFPF